MAQNDSEARREDLAVRLSSGNAEQKDRDEALALLLRTSITKDSLAAAISAHETGCDARSAAGRTAGQSSDVAGWRELVFKGGARVIELFKWLVIALIGVAAGKEILTWITK